MREGRGTPCYRKHSLVVFLLVVLGAAALAGCTANSTQVAPITNATAPPTPPLSPTTLQIPTPTSTPIIHQSSTPTQAATPIKIDRARLEQIVWVAYSPTNADPNKGIEATPESIRADLSVLRKAGFTGLVTYGSTGVMGREFPGLAQAQGFQGLIMGVWNPFDQAELAAAQAAAPIPIVLGFCVGNEGLDKRYQMPALSAVMRDLRQATGKPVVTTEEVDDYTDDQLLQLGDWVFPNVHPYFHSQLEPNAAVSWTKAAYDDLTRRTDRFVLLKEVGLPTSGDPQGRLSEVAQEQYYQALAKTDVRFVYFEAFDQLWKNDLPVEPHWGIFSSDRTPKRLGARLMGIESPAPATPTAQGSQAPSTVAVQGATVQSTPAGPFYIYSDAESPNNHFTPSGYMGDVGDIQMDLAFAENPHSGKTSIRVVYTAKGNAPNPCAYNPPCRWAGVYWQEPPNNWGLDAFWKARGYNLSAYGRLTFWARADQPTRIDFKVGGITGPYGDSLVYPRAIAATLTANWQPFEIDLSGGDLSHIIGGFVWVSDWGTNPDGITFYLDDIRFEEK